LASSPQETVPYLAERVRSFGPPDPEHLARLLKDPDSEQFPVRKRATRALEGFGEFAAYAGSIWIFVVLMGTCFMTLGGLYSDKPASIWLSLVACFFLICAAVEMVKCFINRSRVEVLKEVKGLELQLLEYREQMQQRQA
jgi:hypothetical protein